MYTLFADKTSIYNRIIEKKRLKNLLEKQERKTKRWITSGNWKYTKYEKDILKLAEERDTDRNKRDHYGTLHK